MPVSMGATSRELTERISAIAEKCWGGVYETSIAGCRRSGLSGAQRRKTGKRDAGYSREMRRDGESEWAHGAGGEA